MTSIARPPQRVDFTLSRGVRLLAISGAVILGAATLVAVVRALTGMATFGDSGRQLAVIIHVASVTPAIPLGLYMLLARKGTPGHRQFGMAWLALMAVAAISAIFIRMINDGQFSWIHLFVPFTLVMIIRAVVSARSGRIAVHKRTVVGLYLGALMIPGLFSFLPDRLMWVWLTR